MSEVEGEVEGEEEAVECNLEELKKYLKGEDKVLIVVRQPRCAACNAFDKSVMPEILTDGFPEDVGFALVTLNQEDEECNKIAQELDIMATPTVLVAKRGEITHRYDPTLKKEKDVEAIKKILDEL